MNERRYPGLFLVILAYVGFVSLGFPDAVIGVAWPSVRDTFRLPQGAAGFVFAAAGLGYFASSFFSGRLTHIMSIGTLLAASTALVAAAMFGFAFSPIWILFVMCGTVHGLGSGAIDAGLNGYAANHLSSRHMNWLHACFCFGAMLGPLLMTAVLTSGEPYRTGYIIVGGTMVALCLVFIATRARWGGAIPATADDAPRVGTRDALRHPAVRIQMAVFFLYTGLEAAMSLWGFTILTESRGVERGLAGIAIGVYWGSLGTGRLVFGLFADRIGLDRLVRLGLLTALAGVALFAAPLPIEASFAGLALAGIGLAPVFPCLMTRTPQRLGRALSAHAIGFQVGAATMGAAAIPAALGVLAGQAGLEWVPAATAALAAVLWLLHEALIRRLDKSAGIVEHAGNPSLVSPT